MATIPSIATVPSGFKAGTLYSVLPTNGNADLDVVRNSTANRINKDGLIEEMAVNVPLLDYSDSTCPSLLLQPQSTNLITYPISFGNSYWTKSGASIEGDASTAGSELVTNGDFESGLFGSVNNGSGGVVSTWALNTSFPISGTQDGKLSVTTVGTGSSYPRLIVPVTIVLGKTYLYTFNYKVNSGVCNINSIFKGGGGSETLDKDLTGSGTFTRYFEALGTGTFSTNFNGINLFDVQIDNVSVKEVQGFSAPSVDNPTSAFKSTFASSGSNIRIYLSTSANTTASFSLYVKKSPTNPATAIRLSTNNTVADGTGVEAKLVLTDNWQRIEVSGVINSGATAAAYLIIGTLTQAGTSDPECVGDVYIFGAQLEQQSFATSLMLPTTEGSTTTRLKDEVSKSGLSALINSEEGTLFVEMAALANDGVAKEFYLTDATNSNYVKLGYDTTSNSIAASVYNGSQQGAVYWTDYDITSNFKIAYKYKSGDFALWINGIEVDTSAVGNTISAGVLNKISLSNTSVNLNSKIKSIQIFKTALSDTKLAELTS